MGKIKIKQGLEQKKISEYCIKIGMKEIDNEDYQNAINSLIEKNGEL